ncbi:MAG: hypothetical protein H8D22_03370 [Candidatus Cloacimonetes bacterium]|nr:hypothetical protein [Candidatus Cloacimonadota bacterium]
MITQEQKDRFIELRAKGLSFEKISKDMDISKPTLIKISRGLTEQIKNLKAVELEAIQEKFFLLKKQRIEAFGEQLEKIKAELENRDFSDISTDKLLDYFQKYYQNLTEETKELVFSVYEESKIDELLGVPMVSKISWKP